jgi:hypothetical protein
MKRTLFSLLASLVSLSLAGCTLSLLATPTPSPTPLAATPTLFSAPTETILPTKTPTPEPTQTPEPLGGSDVAYLYDGMYIPMPEGVKSLLTPSSPDTWNQTGWFFTDGTPYP